MYRYLDRPLDALHRHDRLLAVSMRYWVRAAAVGRCPCSSIAPAFRYEGAEPALGDFSMAMAVLNMEARAPVRFAAPSTPEVGEDEARMLALFAAGAGDTASLTRRLSSQLVRDKAVPTLTTAVERVGAVLSALDPRQSSQSITGL